MRSSSPDDGPILILRHLHGEPRGFEDVRATDVVPMSADGEPIAGVDLPGERYIHSAVYARRPDVGSVLHYHSALTAA